MIIFVMVILSSGHFSRSETDPNLEQVPIATKSGYLPIRRFPTMKRMKWKSVLHSAASQMFR